jgi:hypothetical protein
LLHARASPLHCLCRCVSPRLCSLTAVASPFAACSCGGSGLRRRCAPMTTSRLEPARTAAFRPVRPRIINLPAGACPHGVGLTPLRCARRQRLRSLPSSCVLTRWPPEVVHAHTVVAAAAYQEDVCSRGGAQPPELAPRRPHLMCRWWPASSGTLFHREWEKNVWWREVGRG